MSEELCPRCQRPVDAHTVAEIRTCMKDLHDHDLPFKEMPDGIQHQDLPVVQVGAIAVKAGVSSSPLGHFPVLVFEFTGIEGPIPSIALVLDDSHMRSVRQLVSSAVDASLRAARKQR